MVRKKREDRDGLRIDAPNSGASGGTNDGRGDVQKLSEELEEKVALLSRTNRQLKRKIFDLYTVFEISRNFNAVLEYQSLLDVFILTCLGQVGALKGAIFLKRNSRSNSFHMAQSKGSGDFPPEDVGFPDDSRLAKYLTRLNRPVSPRELMTDISTDLEISILKHFDPGIVVPLIYQTRLTGIFAMSDKLSGREFVMDDLEFLSILGNQIAVAIENARLYEGEKMAIKQLRAAQQQLVQSEKLAALGEMSAKIAHEVNNPLGIIKNYILLLQRACEEDHEAVKHVSVVSEEIDRIARIVRQLLEFHRPDGVAFESINVTSVIESVLLLWEQQLDQSSITLSRQYDSDVPNIKGSPENLKQVFLNLIINARDVMPDGGELRVEVGRHRDTVFIRFIDTGPGIPPEIIPRVFDPFFTTKEQGKGTGLGLSVCYGIIKSHKGSITFKNMSPGGCFEIRLPVVFEDEAHDFSI